MSARVRAECRLRRGVLNEWFEVCAQHLPCGPARLYRDDRVVVQFAEPAHVGDNGRDTGGHDAAETPRRFADGSLAQVERDVGLADATLELGERDVARYLNAVFESVPTDERAHVEEVVRLSDERVAEVLRAAQVCERAQGPLDAFVRRDESERGDANRPLRLRGGARAAGGGARRNVVSDASDGDSGRDTSEALAAPNGVDDYALGGARETTVEWEVQRARGDRGRCAARARFPGLARRRVAVAGRDLFEINPQVAALARKAQ